MSYVSDQKRVSEIISKLPKLTPPVNENKLKFSSEMFNKLKSVVSSIDDGRMSRLLSEDAQTQAMTNMFSININENCVLVVVQFIPIPFF